ncbi:hypothetical protein JTE90_028327 [Oedothorax gibbosus]|uniref:Uncharacterized protein n=1 Tax=Oedothorax gibbosus TaxID=931172 RepID=A0AAV6V2E8_9ARAC|nr:hypothetical protein JTE90_028327 [Oedothorax gibbosus]
MEGRSLDVWIPTKDADDEDFIGTELGKREHWMDSIVKKMREDTPGDMSAPPRHRHQPPHPHTWMDPCDNRKRHSGIRARELKCRAN